MTKPTDPTLTTIRVEMVRRGLRQQDLAEAIGCTQGAISARLTGRIQFRLDELRAIAALLDVDIADLVAGAA